jgi:hypothetical protein
MVGAGRISVGAILSLLIIGSQSPSSLAAEIEKGLPETPSSAAAVVGTYLCYDGVAYRVTLTFNSNGTYWAWGSSCLKNKGEASGAGTWKLAGRRIVLAPSKEEGWMAKELSWLDAVTGVADGGQDAGVDTFLIVNGETGQRDVMMINANDDSIAREWRSPGRNLSVNRLFPG